MEKFNTKNASLYPASVNFQRMPILLTLFALIFAGQLKAQGGCGDMTPSFINYEPCKYRVKIDNTSIDCFAPTITVFIDQGAFESWSANTPGGWTGQELAPNIVQLTYSGFAMPLDSSFPMIFTLPVGLVTSANFNWEYTCFPGESCTFFPGIELTSCPDPQNASIIGVKYRECGSLPYGNQTPLGDWTIQAIDELGNIKEAVTAADGAYAIYDLPKGQYIVREVQQPGWTPRVPASGQYTIDLAPSQQRVINFGNCPPPPPPCDCPAGTQPGGNAVVNGDFSGSGGFTTGYTLNNNNPPLQPGQYWIGSNPSTINAGFAVCGDHTSGSGNMMVVNGSTNANAAIWSQTYTMAPNSTYKFEYWVASLSSASPAQLISVMQINNVLYGQNEYAPVTTCNWEKKCRVWTTNASPATITISLYNQNIATTGNDFAIDDISFRRCVPPHGTITGRVYQTCDSMAYTNQPGLGGQTVQVLDTMGNIISEQMTDTSGGYAFSDLPLGWYWVKVASQPGWTPNVPASGQTTVEIEAGETVVENFGICNYDCSCNRVQTAVTPTSSGPGACCYSLSTVVNGIAAPCFPYINLQVDAGTTISPSFVQTGWVATQISPQWIQLLPQNGALPVGNSSPMTFCVSGGSVHNILVIVGTLSLTTPECDNNFTFSCSDCGGGCPSPTGLAVSDIDLTSATISWIPSVCAESTWLYLIDEQDSSEHISRPIPVSSLLLEDLIPGALYRIVAFSMCGTEMSGPSDTMYFSTPCSDCPDNLLKNGGFEIPLVPNMSTPNALGQIRYSDGWSSTGFFSGNESDWFSWGYSLFNNFPGAYYNTSTQLYTVLLPKCGKKYAGFDFNVCEGISADLSAPIVSGDGYEIDIWWSVKEPVTQNFSFKSGLTGSGSCFTYSGFVGCYSNCGVHGPTIYVTTNHKPGVWYHSSFSGNYNNPGGVTLTSLMIAPSIFSSANNYIFIDDVCVRKRIIPCNTGSPRITQLPDQPHAFLGEAELGPGSTLVSSVWDFGDGTQDSSCCLGSVIHDFAPGSYEVCLTVTAMDTSGATCSNSTCIPVDITTQSTKCDHVATFLYPALIGEDCCYTLNINNTEQDCFTQIDLSLSSGSFANSQFFGNYNVVNNGSAVSLTPAPGPFLPLGQDIPIMICDPGGVDPYTVDIDFVYAGDVCHRSISYSCEDNCECLGFSNMQFTAMQTPTAPPPVAVDCDNSTPVVLPCVPNDVIYNFEGNFGCSNECISSVHYQFYDQNHNPLQNGLANYDSGLDYFNLNPGFKFVPGTYQLVLAGICGTGDTCYCTLNFTIDLCGCCSTNQTAFTQTVDNATSVSTDPANCKATLNIGNLPCQQINWINWGDGSPLDIGPYASGAMPMHTYTQSGNYTITFNASEINANTGASCYVGTFTETITLNCPSCNCQESNLAFEQNGISHPVLCGNPSQTPTLGCPVSDVTLTGSLGCVQPNGNPCTQSLISWNLYGPNGFVSKGTLTGPTLNITFPAVDITAVGTYTVSLQTLCPGQTDSCYCQLQWIQSSCNPCCLGDYAAFLATAMNVQTFGTLGACSLSFQGVGLTDCMQIRYDWGDNSSSGPFGDNTPVSHTYTQSGSYNVCYTIEEVNAGGFACYNFQSCEQVNVICNDCVCGSFSDLYARPTVGGQSIALTCGGNYTFGCPNPGFSIPITGKFECLGATCAATTQVNWTLSGPGGSYSGSVNAEPYFALSILPSQYSQPGVYTLTIQGNCDGQACTTCVIVFTVNCPDPCPCDPVVFQQDVAKGFANALWLNSCQACFSPIALNDCDMVQWSVNGGAPVATTIGYQSFCYTFSGSGTYTVTMMVVRKKSDGTICAQASYSRAVTITCLNWDDCNNPAISNPRFSVGAVVGGLNSGGASEGWYAPCGEPVVTKSFPGANDDWTIHLTGNLDSADVLSRLNPVCLDKSAGMISLRLCMWWFYDDVPVYCPPKPKEKLVIELYRGDVFEMNDCEGLDCYKLVSMPLPNDSSGWFEIQIPYDLSDWAALDTCGDAPYGLLVRPAIFVTNGLGSEQGIDTRSNIYLDNFCLDGALVAVNNPVQGIGIRVYPNPNPGTFSVELPKAATPAMSFRIIGLTGQLLREQSTQTGSAMQTVQAGDLPMGLYFLQVVEDGKVLAIEKFVKQ